jgi:hypothetical protein
MYYFASVVYQDSNFRDAIAAGIPSRSFDIDDCVHINKAVWR